MVDQHLRLGTPSKAKKSYIGSGTTGAHAHRRRSVFKNNIIGGVGGSFQV
jgi:hypothetical protein